MAVDHNERIPDAQFRNAGPGFPEHWEGKTIKRVFEVEDSDRSEIALLFEDGSLYLLSCDPGFDKDLIHRTPDHWELVVYDASDTEAGREFA